MNYFECFNLILYFIESQVKSKYKQHYFKKVKSNVFGLVFELNTFDFLNIFSINFVIEVIDGVVYFIHSPCYSIPLFFLFYFIFIFMFFSIVCVIT